MFLQKLKLSPEKSYKTSVELQNLIENLQLSFKRIPIITPFSSNSETLEDVKSSLNNSDKPSAHVIDCPTFLQLQKLFDSTHVVLTDPELFNKFSIDISSINRPFIVVGDWPEPLPILQLCNFSVNYKGEDAYVALFILTRLFKGTVVCKRTERLKIFFKVLGIDWDLVKSTDNKSLKGECVIVMDGCVKPEAVSEAERVFWVGSAGTGSHPFELNLKTAGKYKYRIGDLYRTITPAVIKGIKEFDYARFKRIID